MKRKRINWRRKRWTSFGDLKCKSKMFANFYGSLNLSYSSFNFCNFSLDYLCKFSLALILEQKKLKPTFKKWKQIVILVFTFWNVITSFYEMTSHFLVFHFRANILMICIFFKLFDICRLLVKFILRPTWATINTY
jgi:hypothetical protein